MFIKIVYAWNECFVSKILNEFQVGNSVIDVIRLNSLFFLLLDFKVHIATFSKI